MNHSNKQNISDLQDDALREWFGRFKWPAIDTAFQFDQQRWDHEFSRRQQQQPGRVRPWQWVAILVLTTGFGVGTALRHSAQSRPEPAATATPGPKFLAAKASPVIVEAMKALGSHPGVALEAPQAIPYAKQPTTILSAFAHVFGGSALPTYQVILWQTAQAWPVNNPHIAAPTSQRLAEYSGTNYASEGAQGVHTGLKIESGYSVAPGPTTLVPIAPGIIGKETSSYASATSLAATSLSWATGPWRMVVSAPSATLARQEAQQLVHSLVSVGLPQPTTGGYLVVNSITSVTAQGSPRIATEAIVTWNRGTTVYQVTTYSDVQQRLQTALLIAHSMRPYHP